MRKTIFYRYFIRSVILLSVSMLALSASFVVGASRILGAQQRVKMRAAAQQVREYVVPRITLEGIGLAVQRELLGVLPLMAGIGEMNILICGPDGAVVLNSAASLTGTAEQRLPEKALELLKTGGDAALPPRIMGELVPDAAMTIAAPLIVNVIQPGVGAAEMVMGYILVSTYQSGTRMLMNEFLRNWSLMSVIVVLLSGVTAYFSARRQTRPLRQMAACAHSFERGDFSARADVEEFQDGEIHDLAQAFNGMAETLQRGEELRRGFIANVSHELKTPMTTISGFIGGILDGTVPEGKRGETLQIVRDEVMRLSRLVESTASLSRLQTGQLELHPRPFDIAELSLRILLGFEGRIEEKELEVRLDVPEQETLYVRADPDSITQVLTNLLDNAVKFSVRGGELGLAVRPLAGKARVSVSNHGPTIPPGDLPYVFDRFYKADRSRSADRTGLGLGLFLVRSILSAHDEGISVTSADGRTEFTFTLTECREP
ncbi:MAG: HAMP domain-containing protein [Oscillospiraceae bacterium]|jgi:signal transduction histidine kinase|nr:HAMP domain-containing protein [Oscillospiraceae bacterium]